MPYVDRSDLGDLELVTSGGEGRIYLVDDNVPGCPAELVYKEYNPAGRPVSRAGMEAIVRVRQDLCRDQRALFDRYFVWPLRVVIEEESVAGVLLQRVPDRFFHSCESLVGPRRILRDIEHLLKSRDSVASIDLDYPSRAKRLALVHEFAKGIALLHHQNVVYGDINLQNPLYALRPHPAVMFVAWDGVRIQGVQPLVETGQRRVPEFDPPEGVQVQNKATDQYKLAVFVRMVLSPGLKGEASEKAAFRALDSRGRALLQGGLSADPSGRPSARDWVAYIRSLWKKPPPLASYGDLVM